MTTFLTDFRIINMTEYPISFEMEDYQLFKKLVLFTILFKTTKRSSGSSYGTTGIAYFQELCTFIKVRNLELEVT